MDNQNEKMKLLRELRAEVHRMRVKKIDSIHPVDDYPRGRWDAFIEVLNMIGKIEIREENNSP